MLEGGGCGVERVWWRVKGMEGWGVMERGGGDGGGRGEGGVEGGGREGEWRGEAGRGSDAGGEGGMGSSGGRGSSGGGSSVKGWREGEQQLTHLSSSLPVSVHAS